MGSANGSEGLEESPEQCMTQACTDALGLPAAADLSAPPISFPAQA